MVCELERSWSGLRIGEVFRDEGGENLGARASDEEKDGKVGDLGDAGVLWPALEDMLRAQCRS